MSGLRFQELVNMSRDGYGGRSLFHHQKTEKGEESLNDAYAKILATSFRFDNYFPTPKKGERKKTGFIDKNGHEALEGDIIECGEPDGDPSFRYIMFFDKSEFNGKGSWLARQNGCTSSIGPGYWGKDFVVVGNIYDNPELLEGKKS